MSQKLASYVERDNLTIFYSTFIIACSAGGLPFKTVWRLPFITMWQLVSYEGLSIGNILLPF